MIWLSDHDWNIWKEGCVSSLLQGDTESKRLLRDRRAAVLKGKWNMCCRCRGFRGSVFSCLLPATTQTSLSIPIDPTSAAVMFHLEWLELCDLLCSSPLPFELSFVSRFLIKQDDLCYACFCLSRARTGRRKAFHGRLWLHSLPQCTDWKLVSKLKYFWGELLYVVFSRDLECSGVKEKRRSSQLIGPNQQITELSMFNAWSEAITFNY